MTSRSSLRLCGCLQGRQSSFVVSSLSTLILVFSVAVTWVLPTCTAQAHSSINVSRRTAKNSNNDTITTALVSECPILSFFPLGSLIQEQELPLERWTPREYNRVSTSYLIAAHLALEHFQNRNARIVPELASLDKDACSNVQLSLDVVSQNVNMKQAGRIVMDKRSETCAYLGNYNAEIARVVQPMSVSLDIPQIIYATLDPFLVHDGRETAVGMLPSVLPRTTALARYLNDSPHILPKRLYLSMVYEGEDYLSAFKAACFQEDSADKFGLHSTKQADDHIGLFPTQTLLEFQADLYDKIQQSGVKTIWINKNKASDLVTVATLLDERNMLTNEYVYIFTSEMFPSDNLGVQIGPLEVDSPLDRLLRGGLFIDHMDPFRYNSQHIMQQQQQNDEDSSKEDPFVKAWREALAGDDFIQNLSLQYPDFPKELFADLLNGGNSEGKSESSLPLPASYASHLYDAIIAAGYGACLAANTTQNFHLTANDVIQTTFHGASGLNEWGCFGRNRCPTNHRFGMYNIRAIPIQNDGSTTMHTYEAKLTALLSADGEHWEKIDDNVYRDGTTSAPTVLREVLDNHYLSKPVRIFGLFLFGVAVLTSLTSLVCLYIYRKESLITRSQPFFLSFLCLGSFLTSLAILTLSFDEGWGRSEMAPRMLDSACTMTVWFFFVGQIMTFMALVCKLWRLDRVSQFRRTNSKRGQTLLPLVGFVLVTMSLLTVWTIVDPFVWSRKFISMVPAETYGRCKCNSFWAFFGPLMAIVILAKALAVYYAYKTMNAHEDFRDTQTTMFALVTELEAWLIGIPILAVLGTDTSANAVYLGRVCLIWILAMSSVTIVVGPRLYKVFQKNWHGRVSIHMPRIHISGLNSGAFTRSSPWDSMNTIRTSARNMQQQQKAPQNQHDSSSSRSKQSSSRRGSPGLVSFASAKAKCTHEDSDGDLLPSLRATPRGFQSSERQDSSGNGTATTYPGSVGSSWMSTTDDGLDGHSSIRHGLRSLEVTEECEDESEDEDETTTKITPPDTDSGVFGGVC